MYPPLSNIKQKSAELKPDRDKDMVKKLGAGLLVFWGISVISFLAGRCPEAEIDEIMGTISYSGSESQARASIRHAMGIDQPIHLHYLRWLGIWPKEDDRFQGVVEGYLGDEVWR